MTAEKKSHSFGIIKSKLDTIEAPVAEVKEWKLPPFQRPLRVNEKVRLLAEQIRHDGGVIPGALTFGIFQGKRFIIDGNHRREAGLLSGKDPLYADVRELTFESMSAMADEFVRLNSSLVKFRPDDVLRGMEPTFASLQRIRKSCGWVGYDCVRRSENTPMLSMSVALRSWNISGKEVPSGATSAMAYAAEISHDEVTNLISFLLLVMDAWGRDREYIRLWGALNLTLCMWLFRRVVIGENASIKVTRLNAAQWRKCMVALTADEGYTDFLTGRLMNDRHRAPAYKRLKAIIGNRAGSDAGKKIIMPAPEWAHGK